MPAVSCLFGRVMGGREEGCSDGCKCEIDRGEVITTFDVRLFKKLFKKLKLKLLETVISGLSDRGTHAAAHADEGFCRRSPGSLQRAPDR